MNGKEKLTPRKQPIYRPIPTRTVTTLETKKQKKTARKSVATVGLHQMGCRGDERGGKKNERGHRRGAKAKTQFPQEGN